MLNVHNTKLADVPRAFGAIPLVGKDAKFTGTVQDNGGFSTHLQGLAAHGDVHLLTHSDEGKPAGRIFIADRRPDQRRLLGTFDLPVVSATEPFYFHAGGCQLLGDCLVVPCETGQNKSVVMFLDVSDHMQIREFDVGLRIPRNDRDAAAAGVTDFVRDGHDVWLLAVFDSGTVDFYESLDLTDAVPFFSRFSCKVPEKHHEALVLLTDTSNRVFAVGLNKTFFGEDTAVLYEVDLANEKLNPVTEVSYTTRNGASLRWAASFEIVSDTNLRLHCTSKHYHNGCHINTFDATSPVRRRTTQRRGTGRRTRQPRSRRGRR